METFFFTFNETKKLSTLITTELNFELKKENRKKRNNLRHSGIGSEAWALAKDLRAIVYFLIGYDVSSKCSRSATIPKDLSSHPAGSWTDLNEESANDIKVKIWLVCPTRNIGSVKNYSML